MSSETEVAAPPSVDIAEAMALMDAAGDHEAEVPVAGEVETAEAAGDQEPLENETGSEETPVEGAPEFWSAEDKASWDAVPPELRPVLKKYEQQRVEFVNEKAREAASLRAQAAEEVQRANATVDQAAAWWQQAGPALQRAFADKWSAVNWGELAEKNPTEWARLNQMRMDEAALLVEANRRGQADMQAATQRAQHEFQVAKHTEHAKLAARLPEYFGPDKAQRTYEELGHWLLSKGIAADRINSIHEAPIIELALNAWRFEQAQKRVLRSTEGKASSVTARAGTANTTGNATPRRVQPGPAARTGNRAGEAARQVGERFRKSGGASIADAAELIRLSGL